MNAECLKYRPPKSPEPLKTHELPTRPCEKVGSDLFHLNGKNYIILTDYYSYQLMKTKTENIITVMKDIFARHGVPTKLVSDNGFQYISRTFRKFAETWGFKLITSSPVKTIKHMIKKCVESNKDIKLGLLNIINTPLYCGASPAELLMCRQLQDNLPRLPSNLRNTRTKKRDLIKERTNQKTYHDRKISKQRFVPHWPTCSHTKPRNGPSKAE